MPRFKVKTAFKVSSSTSLVMEGDVIEGTINADQYVLFEYQGESFQRVIQSIGVVDHHIGRPTFHAHVALIIEDQDNTFDPQRIKPQEVIVSDDHRLERK